MSKKLFSEHIEYHYNPNAEYKGSKIDAYQPIFVGLSHGDYVKVKYKSSFPPYDIYEEKGTITLFYSHSGIRLKYENEWGEINETEFIDIQNVLKIEKIKEKK